MTFTPTPEQSAIVAFAREESGNLLVSALAGAAKTSTLVLIAEALPRIQILAISFNKRIQLEMQERLPRNCTAKTLNGWGHAAWGKAIGRNLTLDARKNYKILTELVSDLPDGPDKEEAFTLFSDTLRAIEYGKTCGYVPDGHYPNAKRLLDNEELFANLDDEPTDIQRELIINASLISLKQSYAGIIDYDDQILMPTVMPCTFPIYPLVLVDEAQDLSALNHAMLRKFARKRLIAVGDECQSIYGFRGAHEDSMELLKETFDMTELRLSISFRCPIAVVEEARWRAPHMQYPEWAKPGLVQHLPSWGVADLPEDTTILCRNNAPLFSMAIELLSNGRYPELVGNDIGKALIKILKKLGPLDTGRRGVIMLINDWEEARLRRSRDPDKIKDQAKCLRIFAERGRTLGEAIAYAEALLSMAGPVKLMTGHKSKGLEFDNVFILDQDLIGKSQQDKNLRYVMQTRSKSTLTYIKSEDFQETNNDPDA